MQSLNQETIQNHGFVDYNQTGIYTSGNKIMLNGREFVFRGATLFDTYVGSQGSWDESRYRTLFRDLKAINLNTVRLYMNWVRFIQDATYRANLHKILAIANENNMFVVYVGAKRIAEPWSMNIWFYGSFVIPELRDVIPNRDAINSIYSSKWLEFTEKNFFLEIMNEPMLGEVEHKATGYYRRFNRYDGDTLDNQRIWAEDSQSMITYLRNNGFTAPIILGWGYGTISPFDDPYDYRWNMNWYRRFTFSGSNLIYTRGNYRYHGAIGNHIDDKNKRPTDRDSILESLEDHGILYAKSRDPVLIYECGTHNDYRSTDDIWFNNLLSIFNERGLSWMAHSFRYPSSSLPWGFRGTSTEVVIKQRASDPQL